MAKVPRNSSYKEHRRISTVPQKRMEAVPNVLEYQSHNIKTSSSPKQVRVTNTGDRDIVIKAVRYTGEFSISHNAPDILKPGQFFKVSVIFLPKSQGPKTGSVYVETDDADGTEYVTLTGFGVLSEEDESALQPYAKAVAIGIEPQDNNLGVLESDYIPDNVSVKTAIQALSTRLSVIGDGGSGDVSQEEFDQLEGRVTALEQAGPIDPTDPEYIYEGLTAYLTNESHTLVASTNGVIISYGGATTQFIIFLMDEVVTPYFDYSVHTNPGGIEGSWVGNTYTATGGFKTNDDTANVTLRATGKVGTGYEGIIVDKVFSLAKAKGGANAKTLYVISDRQTIHVDAYDTPVPPNQTIVFTAVKQNTTAEVNWSVTDINNVARIPASTYLSGATGDSVSMSFSQFMNARNGTSGVIVTGTIVEDGVTISDKISVVKVNQGAQGVQGVDGFDGEDGIWVEFVFRRAATKPSTPTMNGIPTGWQDDPYDDGSGNPLWMSSSRQELDGTIVQGTTWSEPVEFNGRKGEDAIGYIQESDPGEPGSPHQFWYKPSTKQTFYWNGTSWVQSTGNLALYDQVLSAHIGANQVLANHVTTGELITSNAQIGDGIIRNVHIGNAEIKNAKIGNLEVGTTKIANQAVTNAWAWASSSYVNIPSNNVPVTFFNQNFTAPEGGFQTISFDLYYLVQHGVVSGGTVTDGQGVDHMVEWFVTTPDLTEHRLWREVILSDVSFFSETVPYVLMNEDAGVWNLTGKITVYSGAEIDTYRVHTSAAQILGLRK